MAFDQVAVDQLAVDQVDFDEKMFAEVYSIEWPTIKLYGPYFDYSFLVL
jgi:hypothetical protein